MKCPIIIVQAAVAMLLGGLGSTVMAQTQATEGRAAATNCFCGNENLTAFPSGQCFVSRPCADALAETGGMPCMGAGQGNCPAGQYCLDANSICGVPTCALQTASCGGVCNTGTGQTPYAPCGVGAPALSHAGLVTLLLSLLGAAGLGLRSRRTTGVS